MQTALGVIGLGTMGANVARNVARNGADVVVFNRTPEKTSEFMAAHGGEGKLRSAATLQQFCALLPAPRHILLMVSAGSAVDAIIEELTPLLDAGDVLIDGGNSHYRDTQRREEQLKRNRIAFVGMGISGGEKGALEGPSMMPGGSHDAVNALLPLLKEMAADDGTGGACVSYIGPGGAGHFVKMVHNGIEYGVMQCIAEAYAMLRASGLDPRGIAQAFASWVTGDGESYLMEITAKILTHEDAESGGLLLEVIRDVAGQKGTGKWTVEAAAEYASAAPTITAAVEARYLSGSPEERLRRSKMFPEVLLDVECGTEDVVSWAKAALEASTLAAYSQGFDLLLRASHMEKWNLPFAEIARIWRGGCIIRSPLLRVFQEAYGGSAEEMRRQRQAIVDRFGGANQRSWRRAVSWAVARGVPVPAIASSLAYYDSIRNARLPQNLIQAQRDFFGAHGFERTDKEGKFHEHWEP